MKKTNLILILSFVLLVAVFTFGAYRVAKAESYTNNVSIKITEDIDFSIDSAMREDISSFNIGEINQHSYSSDYKRNGITNNKSNLTVGMLVPSPHHIVFGIKMERKTVFGAKDTTFSPIGSHGGGSQTVSCVIGTGGSMQFVEFISCQTPYAAPNDREYKRTLN